MPKLRKFSIISRDESKGTFSFVPEEQAKGKKILPAGACHRAGCSCLCRFLYFST